MTDRDRASPPPDESPDGPAARPDVAAEHILGLLAEAEARAYEMMLGADPAAREVADEQRAFLALAMIAAASDGDGHAGAAPPPSLRDRVLGAVRRERFQFVHAHEGSWLSSATPGGAMKLLYAPGGADGAETSPATRLLRVPAGATVAELDAAADAALLVVDGQLESGGERVGAGDFVDAPARGPGAPGWEASSPATLLVIERGGAPRAAHAPTRPRRIVRAGEGEGSWRDLGGGTRTRRLAGGRGESTDIMLLEMPPDSVLPEHEHDGLEEIYLLRGECTAQGRSLGVGDYHRAEHGSEHAPTTTATGCLMLVIVRHEARAA
jgi:hypothetical protein